MIALQELRSRVSFPTRTLDPSKNEDFKGSIGELIMFNESLTKDEVNDIIESLKDKWMCDECPKE